MSVATSGTSNSATTTNIYDEGGGIQGNLTSIDHLFNGNNIKTEGRAYNANGTISIRADAYGAPTNYAYDSSGLFLSTSTNALNQITTYEYDDNTGLLNWVKDANSSGNVTSYTYDSVNRVTAINYPDQGSVSFDYNDTTPSPSVMITRAITASQNESQTAIVDGLGRLVHTQLTSDPDGTDYVTRRMTGWEIRLQSAILTEVQPIPPTDSLISPTMASGG